VSRLIALYVRFTLFPWQAVEMDFFNNL